MHYMSVLSFIPKGTVTSACGTASLPASLASLAVVVCSTVVVHFSRNRCLFSLLATQSAFLNSPCDSVFQRCCYQKCTTISSSHGREYAQVSDLPQCTDY